MSPTPYRIRINGQPFLEDSYRLVDRDLAVVVRYLNGVVTDLREAGVPDRQITVRAEIDAAPYSVEIEVYATEAQATAIEWRIPAPEEAA